MKDQRISVIFFGTSSFAVPILETLANDERYSIISVITQPDRPVGRHAGTEPPAIKIYAERWNVPVMQFESLKINSAYEALKELVPDVAVVASFGQILPQSILDIPRFGMVNVHASLLPKYRGASPISEAIKNGDTETGITLMKMDALLDHGPILAQETIEIQPSETTMTLETRLANLGARTLPNILFDFVNGKIVPREQDHSMATKTKLLTRADGELDWNKSAQEIERLIRAYDPWPGTFFKINDESIKILSASLGQEKPGVTGSRVIVDGWPAVICGDGLTLVLKIVQRQGKRAVDGQAFLRGAKDWC